MKTKCPYCDFGKETVLSVEILKVLAEPGLPQEDFILWMERLLKKTSIISDHMGVKVHVGRMHKGEYNTSRQELNTEEKAILNAKM